MTSWTPADMPDQSGRTVVISGANAGIGFTAAQALANRGAHVVLAVRNVDKGREAASRIAGSTEVRRVDTSDLESVRAFARDLEGDVDVLINNAGIMAAPQQRTAEGFELQFATNYLGAYALTALLLPRLADRVVMLSSIAHRMGTIQIDDLQWRRRAYSKWGAYGQSKLADLVLAYELQRRFTAAESPLRAMAAHPGLSATNLVKSMGLPGPVQTGVEWLTSRAAQPAEAGALPTLYAATVPDLAGGSYIGPDGFGEIRGGPVPVGSRPLSHDREVARLLVQESERLTGVPLEVPAPRS